MRQKSIALAIHLLAKNALFSAGLVSRETFFPVNTMTCRIDILRIFHSYGCEASLWLFTKAPPLSSITFKPIVFAASNKVASGFFLIWICLPPCPRLNKKLPNIKINRLAH